MVAWALEISKRSIWLLLQKYGGVFISNPSPYWAVYYPHFPLGDAKKHARPSYVWTSIFRTSWVFEDGARWRVGDGTKIDSWKDRWLPSGYPLIYREDIAQLANLNFVSSLMVANLQVWNKDLIALVFCPPTAKEILSIPLPLSPSPDVLFWPLTTDGTYTTKTGYDFVRQYRSQNAASPSSSSGARGRGHHKSFWRSLWQAHILSRVKDLGWRATLGILPVRQALRKRGMEVNESCPFCMVSDETTTHVLFQCPIVLRWWFVTPLSLRFRDGDEPTSYLQQLFNTKELKASFEVLLHRVQALMCADGNGLEATAPAREEDHKIAWRRPVGNTIKLNFDASWTSASGAGFGMIARNSNGEVMAAAALGSTSASSVLMAEALAFRWCVSLAKDLRFFRVVLETDCLQLFEAWKKNRPGVSYLFSVLKDCRDMASFFTSFDMSFVRRSGNSVADFLAKNSSNFYNVIWIEEFPPKLDLLVTSDVLAFMAL
ncbi:uncharacterized protein LOC130712400 [Lotus japonicus]|uniref:uncharacterized protein LOC130712400 n=1 Tax=Lotus japonicus TaxID=34305 RepID=UPI00258ADAB3|nr:uncharacterized protein LOC130712400 [Lotus japonicus]